MPFIVDYSGGGRKRLKRAFGFFIMLLLSCVGMIYFETFSNGFYGWYENLQGDMSWKSHGALMIVFFFCFINIIRELALFIKEKPKPINKEK